MSNTAATLPLPDADGFDLKPDPIEARTPAELVRAMRQYRLPALPSAEDLTETVAWTVREIESSAAVA